jgi:nitrate reductase NapAB chaperone NapD
MEQLQINFGSMYNLDGVIMIHMIFSVMLEQNSLTIQQIVFRFIPLQQVVLSQ